MKDILNLGPVINPFDFTKYIEHADKLECVVQKYGDRNPFIFDRPCWLEYRNEGELLGSICFSRNTSKDPVLLEMCEKIVDVLAPILEQVEKPNINRIHLIKTFGSVAMHKDEDGRMSCINIGLQNSNKAVTRIYNKHLDTNATKTFADLRKNFSQISDEYRIIDGNAYLVNTNQWHSVEGDYNVNRYLITYGFRSKYIDIASKIKNHELHV